MLEYEIAAMYYFISGIVTAKPYFEEIPKNMIVPCVFYPTPEQSGGVFSVSKYKTDFVLYIKFIAESTMKAYELANCVMQSVMKNNRKIPLVDENGKATGKRFQINPPVVRKVDNGVYQMEVSWKRYSSYNGNEVTLAKEFFFNGNPVS